MADHQIVLGDGDRLSLSSENGAKVHVFISWINGDVLVANSLLRATNCYFTSVSNCRIQNSIETYVDSVIDQQPQIEVAYQCERGHGIFMEDGICPDCGDELLKVNVMPLSKADSPPASDKRSIFNIFKLRRNR